jgi:hypothetical protein
MVLSCRECACDCTIEAFSPGCRCPCQLCTKARMTLCPCVRRWGGPKAAIADGREHCSCAPTFPAAALAAMGTRVDLQRARALHWVPASRSVGRAATTCLKVPASTSRQTQSFAASGATLSTARPSGRTQRDASNVTSRACLAAEAVCCAPSALPGTCLSPSNARQRTAPDSPLPLGPPTTQASAVRLASQHTTWRSHVQSATSACLHLADGAA